MLIENNFCTSSCPIVILVTIAVDRSLLLDRLMDKESKFRVGDRVKLIALPTYIKTADPMPMLRSPNILTVGEAGTIIDRRPGGYYGIRFEGGNFLLESQYFDRC
jgi:hypothetical protein